MKDMLGNHTLLRIFLGENVQIHGKPAYRVVLELLRREKLAGATVLRGISGFGARSHLHDSRLLAISEKLPILIEAVDTEEKIRGLLPQIDNLLPEGFITLENVEVIRYHPKTST